MTGPVSTEATVNRIVAKHLDVDPADLGPGLTFAKLGASDVDHITLVMAVEDTFDFEATDEDAENVKTIGDMVRLVDRMTGLQAAA